MSGRRKLNTIATACVGALLAGSLAYAAIDTDGYKADHVTLNDGAVWLVRDGIELGRMNYDLQKVDTKSRAGLFGSIVDLHQIDNTVVVETADKLFAYDVALNATAGDGMPKAAGGAQVSIGGQNGAYLDLAEGRFWFTDRSGVTAIDTADGKTTEGSVELPKATRVVVGVDGTAHVVAPETSTIWTFPEAWGTTADATTLKTARPTTTAATAATSAAVSEITEPLVDPKLLAGLALSKAKLTADEFQMTTAGPHAVLLQGRNLIVDDDRMLPLPAEVGDDPKLQWPSTDAAKVLVASTKGLAMVSLTSGAAEVEHQHAASGPVAPVWLNNCAYGAWSDEVFSSCSTKQTAARSSTTDARFRQNRDHVVLNYADGTADFFLDGEIRSIENKWDDAFDPDQKDLTEQSNEQQKEANKCEKPANNTPPVAVADASFRVRTGRSTKIDVINPPNADSAATDADCDVLTVSIPAEKQLKPEQGVLAVIDNGRAFQYTPPAATPAQAVTFEYVLSDGNDKGGVSATATIAVLADTDAGEAPHANLDRTTVEVGKTVVIDVLANDWDPEGDAVSVVTAKLPSASDGSLVWQPSGRFAYTAPGSGVGTKAVPYAVRDSRGLTAEGTLEINVISAGVKSPPNALSDAEHGMLSSDPTQKKTFAMNVLANDSDPNGDSLRLVDVVAYPTETTKATRDDAGNVSITPDAAGSYNFAYTVVDASGETAVGRARFEILPGQGEVAPVAVTDAAIVTTERSVVVDVLQNDTDLNSDLLAITDVTIPTDTKDELNVEVLEHRLVRISARSSSLVRTAYSFNYTVSDGSLSSTTTVNLGVASSSVQQPPVALDDRAEVHLGGYVSMPVLGNDFDPSGIPLTITTAVLDEKVAEQGVPGVVFVQENKVRYLAPSAADRPSPFTATGTYTVSNGRDVASGRFTISVTDPRNGNRAPKPKPMELRTVAGEAVTLVLPSSGLDPDGDPVELVSQDSPLPAIGSVTSGEDAASLVYTPLQGRTGSDHFRWKLRDYKDIGYLDVRVVVTPKPTGNKPPVAVTDLAQVEVGKTTAIPVLANDTDPDGDTLQFAAAKAFDPPNPGAGTVTVGNDGFLSYQAPPSAGDFAFIYYITDGTSAPVPGLVRVRSTTPDKLVNRAPIVRDIVLPAHRAGEQVTVPLKGRASDPEGQALSFGTGRDADKLGVTLVQGPDGPGLSLTMAASPMLFTFLVADELGAQSTGVVQIPVPENRAPKAEEITVTMEEGETTKKIDVPSSTFSDPDGDVVAVRRESNPTLEPAEASGGGDLKWDSDTAFTFNRNPDFGGSAKLTYYIQDKPASGQEPIVVPATIVLSIKKKVNQPPVATEGALEVVSGSEVGFDLSRLVTDPDPEDQGKLTFTSVTYKGPDAVTMTATGAVVSFKAALDAAVNGETKTAEVTFTADDGKENGKVQGTLRVTVVETNLAKPQAVDDLEEPVKQGESPTWNLLTNDPPNGAGAYTIVGVTSTNMGTVTVVGTDSVKFTPAPDTSGPVTFQYTIEDPAKRQATATVRSSVEDRPATPGQPTVGEQLSRTAVVSFARPDERGSPIDSYEVQGSPAGAITCTSSPCTLSGLTNGVEHTFKVRAHNGVGWSEWSPASAPYTPDELPGVPPTPSADWNDKAATVQWGTIPNEGSEIIDVTVSISPGDASAIVSAGGQGGGTVTFTGLKNGTAYTFSLVARNKKGNSPASPQSASVVPAGAPSFPSAPTLAAFNGFVTVTWPAANGNGDDALAYKVRLIDQAGPTTETSVGATLTTQLPAVNGHSYRAIINASNKYSARYATAGVDSAQSNAEKAIGPPKAPASITATAGAGNGAVNLAWAAADANGGSISQYQISANNGAWENVGTGTSLTKGGLTLGQSYTFRVRALNDNKAGDPGDVSVPSGAAIPYLPPAQPGVNCSRTNAYGITCNWAIGALNGPGAPQVTVTGIGNSNAGSGTFTTGTLDYNITQGLNVTVCNSGSSGNNCAGNSAAANTGDYRSVSSSRGASAGACQVGSGTCYYINLNISGFLPGSHTFQCFGGAVVANKVWSGTIGADGNGNGGITTQNTSPFCFAASAADADMTVEGRHAPNNW